MRSPRATNGTRAGQIHTINLRQRKLKSPRSNTIDQTSFDSNDKSEQYTRPAGLGGRTDSFKYHSVDKESVQDVETGLVGRLQELSILEINKDGGRTRLQLSVRGLYRHVISCITNVRSTSLAEDAATSFVFRRTGDKQDDIEANSISESLDVSDRNEHNNSHLNGEHVNIAFDNTITGAENLSRSGNITSKHRPIGLEIPNFGTSRKREVSTGDEYLGYSNEKLYNEDHFSDRQRSRNILQPAPPSHPVTYRERLGAYIHPRDMRRLVTPLSASNEPELIVRRHVMLLNFDPLQAIILRDRILVIVPDHDAAFFLSELEHRIRGGAEGMMNSIFGTSSTDEFNAEIEKNNFASSQPKSGTKDQLIDNEMEPGRFTSQNTRFGVRHVLSLNSFNKLTSEESKHLVQPTEDLFRNSDRHINSLDDNGSFRNVDNEWDEMEGRQWINLPFELLCVDAILYVIGSYLNTETELIRESSEEYINNLLSGDTSANTTSTSNMDHPLTSIRSVKVAVREMTARVKGFVQSINRILDEDEDMALMNLSRLLTHPHRFIQPVPPEVLGEESDEPELILEANLQIALSTLNSLNLIQAQIDTASELVDQKLDSVRNRLLFVNMIISIFTLAITSAALVGSFLGMNLRNHMEQNDHAFAIVTIWTIVGIFLLSLTILLVLVRTGTIPTTSFRGM